MNTDFNISTELKQLISSEQAYAYGIVPVEQQGNIITFIARNPSQSLREELQIILGKQIQFLEDSEVNIKKYLSSNFRVSQNKLSNQLNYFFSVMTSV